MVEQKHVLVIDDESDVGMIFSRVLGEYGYRVTTVNSGEEGLKTIASATPDLIFLDLRMPGIDGVETLRRIRKANLELPVIVMTAYQTVSSAVETMKLGAFDYLLKPLDTQQLKAIIARAMQVNAGAKARQKTGKQLHRVVPVEPIFSPNSPMAQVLQMADKVSPTNLTVLLLGESGTGKEVVARYVHSKSQRKDGPFVPVDCAALPESLMESELFGYEKGAFTGADTSKPGRYEAANGGTLFLDEIGNLSHAVQAKLLRVLQEPVIERLGGKSPISLDVRVLAATNLELEKAVGTGQFREDLYHRLKVFSIYLPPLRARKDDLELLLNHFMARYSQELGKSVAEITPRAMRLLRNYPWPGNIRELQNALRSAVLLADTALDVEHLPVSLQFYGKEKTGWSPGSTREEALKDVVKRVEKEHIQVTLKRVNGNRKDAAKILGVDYKTLTSKIKEYDLE